MAGDMGVAALRDLVTTTNDGDWGKNSSAAGLVPYRVIRGTDFPSVRVGDMSSVPIRYLSESSVHRRTLVADDILLETAGGSPDRPTGRTLLIKQEMLSSLDLPATCASFARFLRVDRTKAEPNYVFWFLQYLYASGQIEEHQVQHTGVARFQYTKFAESQEIPLPDRAEQRAIANILGTLDDKIELNRRMNETLEAMARALFKSWFVDFDPVRAKAAGRDPALPKSLADLFPARLVDSELGEIPEGWEVGPLGRFFSVGLGGAWGDDEPSSRASLAVRCLRGIDCHDLAEGRIPQVPVRRLSKKQAEDRALTEGTILIEGSGSFCGRSLLWRSEYGDLIGQPIAYSNFCKRLDPVCTPFQASVCWLQMRRAYREGDLQAFRTGTAFPNFDVNGAIANLTVVVPPETVARAFWRFFGSSQRIDLMAQSHTLASLRDTLLPKLISGDLRVKDAEQFIRRAT